jgi:hypothetical protein
MSCRLARGGLSFTSVVVDSNCSVEVIVGDVDDVGVVGSADDAGGACVLAIVVDKMV